MRTLTSKGIIIKETKSGEADKFIVVLLKDYGKLTIFCKGARNTKSKFLASTSVFSYCEFVIFLGAKTPTLASCELIESFYDLRLSFERLTIGSYFLELSDKLILPDINCDDFIRLLFVGLNNLIKKDKNIDLIKNIFELKFLDLLGMYPANNFCGNCNKSYEDFTNKIFFDINGILCYNCMQNQVTKALLIDTTIVRILSYVLETDIQKVFKLTIDDKTVLKLNQCLSLFIQSNVPENFKSISFMMGK